MKTGWDIYGKVVVTYKPFVPGGLDRAEAHETQI